MGINAAVMPTGKVLFYSYPTNPNPTYGGPLGNDEPNEATAFVWDPEQGHRGQTASASSSRRSCPRPASRPTSGAAASPSTADGTVLVTGGNLDYRPDWKGLDTVYTFNPFTEQWHYEGRMRDGPLVPDAERCSPTAAR